MGAVVAVLILGAQLGVVSDESRASATWAVFDPANAQRVCAGGQMSASWQGPHGGDTPAHRQYAALDLPANATVNVYVTGGRVGRTHFRVGLTPASAPTGSSISAKNEGLFDEGNSNDDEEGRDVSFIEELSGPAAGGSVFFYAMPWSGPNLDDLQLSLRLEIEVGGVELAACELRDTAELLGESQGGSVEDPVNPSIGNFFDRVVDFAAPADAFGMTYARTYNSMDEDPLWDPTTYRTGILGRGWTTPLDTSLRDRPDGSGLTLRLPDGKQFLLPPVSGGRLRGACGPVRVVGDHAWSIACARAPCAVVPKRCGLDVRRLRPLARDG